MKDLLHRISIKNKVIAVVVLTVSIVVAVVFSFLTLREVSSLEANLIHNTDAVAEMLSNFADYALELDEEYNAIQAIEPLKSFHNIIAGQIITKDDSVFITYNTRKDLIEHKKIPRTALSYVGEDFLHVYKPVVKDNKRLGMVYLRADISDLKKQKKEYLTTMGLLFFFVIILAYLLATILQRNVSDPLLKLVSITRDVAETNNYSVELKAKYSDEIGQLFDSFSQMMRKINQRERERDEALEKLNQSKEMFKNISESAFDAIILTDPDAKISYWNHAAQRIFGYKPEWIINKSVDVLLPENYKRGFTSSYQRFKETGQWRFIGKPFEFVALRQDGKQFPIELTISQIGTDKTESLSYTVRDISHRKEYENSLIEARKRAEESDKLKSAFLANMSHEIRTPMNSIIGFSELLLKPNVGNVEREKFLNFIVSSGKSLLNLINDIIDISKIEAGQLKISKTNTDINALLSELFASFYENPKVNKNFELVLKRAFSNQKFTLLTDPYRVKQILINLLTNAFKFTDDGFVEFGYRVPNMNHVEFYVKDTGVGIPEDKLKMIFDRFSQIEDTYFKNQGGTGLGLGISKKLTELLGGEMWVEAELSEGSTFFFTLPYATETGVRKLPPKESKEFKLDNWNERTVLIAEDEESNMFFLEELLKPTGIKVYFAKDGLEAIELFKKHMDEIDIVLMDIKMPEVDGYQAARMIKAERRNVPIIAQTAYAMADEEQRSYEAGCDGYITKPINFNQLLNMMSNLLIGNS